MKQNEAPAASVYYRETYRSSPSRLPQTKRGNRVNRQTSDALQHAGACGRQAGPHSAPRRAPALRAGPAASSPMRVPRDAGMWAPWLTPVPACGFVLCYQCCCVDSTLKMYFEMTAHSWHVTQRASPGGAREQSWQPRPARFSRAQAADRQLPVPYRFLTRRGEGSRCCCRSVPFPSLLYTPSHIPNNSLAKPKAHAWHLASTTSTHNINAWRTNVIR